VTWGLALPATLSFLQKQAPSPLQIAGAGLSAFGPLLAATLLSMRDGSLGEVFRIRTESRWLLWALLALLTPLLLRVLSAAITAAFGFELSRWGSPPALATQVAALIVFPLGEEFGWRGFAYPRLREHFGALRSSLIVGVMWSLWHLGYMVNMSTGELGWVGQLESLIALPLYSIILTWFFERARGSVLVALAFHAAAHLNHIELAPHSEVAFHLIHLGVVAVAAFFAARHLGSDGGGAPSFVKAHSG
jgi:membrane protease YdiL (CAAX protease family)